jgi:protein ImuB
VDSKLVQIDISTTRPSHHVDHLFKLFEIKIATLEPALGIELFVLEALKVEDHLPLQENVWKGSGGLGDTRLAELLDKVISKEGDGCVHRYLPDEHYWPERSFKLALTLQEKPMTDWRSDLQRPALLLRVPERIEVSAPVPDYPPMLFRYKAKVYTIARADGPERIEREWWLEEGQHRDYYRVEDDEGHRYWLFRLGHHDEGNQWFIHGFFA